MENILRINPDIKQDESGTRPSSLVRTIEGKLEDKEEAKKLANIDIAGAATLIARGLVADENIQEVFEYSVRTTREYYQRNHEHPDWISEGAKILPDEDLETNIQALSFFEDLLETPEAFAAYIETTRKELRETVEQARAHAKQYYGQVDFLCRSYGVEVSVPYDEQNIAFLTPSEINYMYITTYLKSLYPDREAAELLDVENSMMEHSKVISRIFTKWDQTDSGEFRLEYSYSPRTLEHEMTHYIGAHIENREPFTNDKGDTYFILYKGLLPKVLNERGGTDAKKLNELRFGPGGIEHGSYDLRTFGEAVTAYIHALVEKEGNTYEARNLLEEYRYVGTFERVDYCRNALQLFDGGLNRLSTNTILKAYFNGRVDLLNEDLKRVGRPLPVLMSGVSD